jgi:hypothetical protein
MSYHWEDQVFCFLFTLVTPRISEGTKSNGYISERTKWVGNITERTNRLTEDASGLHFLLLARRRPAGRLQGSFCLLGVR